MAAARRLVERFAATGPWEEACLGLVDAVAGRLRQGEPPDPAEVTAWFWVACHGGQRTTAELLLGRGAELNWVADWDGLTPLEAARCSEATALAGWLHDLGARSARELT